MQHTGLGLLLWAVPPMAVELLDPLWYYFGGTGLSLAPAGVV